jgi:hypothetical protein
MALAPLATLADMAARGVAVSVDEAPAVAVYLDVASTLVRDAAGSPVSQVTSVVTLEGSGGRLHLPGKPVTAVSAVSIDGVAVSDWKLLSGALARSCGFPDGSEVEVTYTHGLAEVPADIVDLVCRLAGQELLALRNGEVAARPTKSERIGDYAITYDTDVYSGAMVLTDFQRARLAARFGASAGSARSR